MKETIKSSMQPYNNRINIIIKIWITIKKILGSHLFLIIIFSLIYGITAISPNIQNDAQIFCNYIGFIILNALFQELEKRDCNNKIDKLQEQIDKLTKSK